MTTTGYRTAGPTPTSLRLHPNGKFLYGGNGSINTISGYSIGSDGRLTEIAGSPFSTSENFTIHDVEFDPSGNFLYAMDGHIVVFRVDAATGGLTEIIGSPFSTGDVAIAAVIDPTGKFLYAANNHVTVSAFSIDGTTPVAVAVDLSGRFVYTLNQSGANVSGNSIQPDGSLATLPGSPFAAGNGAVELAFSPSGRFLIVANSSDATLQTLSAGADGSLSSTVFQPSSTAVFPRSVGVDPTNSFVYAAIASSFTGDSTIADGFQLAANGGMVVADARTTGFADC